MWIGPTTRENNIKVPQKFKNKSTVYPATPLLGIWKQNLKEAPGKEIRYWLHLKVNPIDKDTNFTSSAGGDSVS